MEKTSSQERPSRVLAKKVNFWIGVVAVLILVAGVGYDVLTWDTTKKNALTDKQKISLSLAIVVPLLVTTILSRFKWAQREIVYKIGGTTLETEVQSLLSTLLIIIAVGLNLVFNRKEDGSLNW